MKKKIILLLSFLILLLLTSCSYFGKEKNTLIDLKFKNPTLDEIFKGYTHQVTKIEKNDMHLFSNKDVAATVSCYFKPGDYEEYSENIRDKSFEYLQKYEENRKIIRTYEGTALKLIDEKNTEITWIVSHNAGPALIYECRIAIGPNKEKSEEKVKDLEMLVDANFFKMTNLLMQGDRK